ncbi:MAG: NAD(+)/NADH kinase [Bacillota bacterium]|nr:NAD(+)/NADH kinase [Candidatus Fermentithermobacillaceae bacterium]
MENAVGIIPNLGKDETWEFAEELIAWLKSRGFKAYWPACARMAFDSGFDIMPLDRWPGNVRFAIVLGGDGTLLGAARGLAPMEIPILGVNLGHFGFLTELETSNAFEYLPEFLSGEFKKDERLMLSAAVIRNGEVVYRGRALNEACIARGHFGRLTVLSLRVSGKDVDTYEGDGIIISTPTGSTAYSLSAGGPIVAPEIDAFLVTPICPHTLYSRSIVVPGSESCEIEVVLPSQSTMLSLDGQEFYSLEKNDMIMIKKSEFKVTLLRRNGWSFYDVLRKKMKEGAARLPRGDAGLSAKP